MTECEALYNLADSLENEQIKFEENSSEGDDFARRFLNAYRNCAGSIVSAEDAVRQLDNLGFFEIPGAPNKANTLENLIGQITAHDEGKENICEDPCEKNVDNGADPVMLFNGQFVHEAQDFEINGAGINFVFARTYKNQVPYNGPLGFNWHHNYNLWMRVANQTIFRFTDDLREEAYFRHPKFGEAGFNYWIPPEGRHSVIIDNDSSFIWRVPNGVRHFYEQDTAHPFLHRISRIEDRYGNYLAFSYQDDKLHEVEVNDSERIVTFEYDERDPIVLIKDYTGRQWCYSYDFFGDLIAFTTPATEGYPEGLTVRYEYSSAQFTGELQHNLTRINDPSGQMYLENEYGTESDRLRFNRVIGQRQGGGEFFFEYEDIVTEFEFDYSDAERPSHQTIMVERNGHHVCHIYNKFGNLLSREESIMEDGLPRKLIWRYRYNRDGALVATLSPEGVITQHLYGREYFVLRHGLVDNGEALQERQSFGRF